MIRITETVWLDENEIHLEFVRSSGPGGQNVNKVATAVQLRFDVQQSACLPAEIQKRLIRIAGQKMTDKGILVIRAQRFRSQEKNRKDAIQRLVELIRKASLKPKTRRKTSPTPAARERRLAAKKKRSESKRRRRRVDVREDP